MRIISRTVLILSFVSLFADISSELLYPVIPVYLQTIGFSVIWIGLLEGIANLTAGLSKGYFGKLSDERGSRLPFVKAGYFLSALAKPLLAFFQFPLWVFFVRTLDRLGKGLRTAPRDALLSAEATPATKARVFGFHRSLDTVGACIGPLLALVFLYFYPGHYRSIFLLAFLPGLFSIALLFFMKEKRQPKPALPRGHFFSFFKYGRIASPDYKRLVAGLWLFALFNSSDIFLLLKTKEITGNDTLTIGMYVFYNFIFALASYPLGAIGDRLGLRKVMLTGLVLFGIVYAGFAFQPGIPALFVLFFLYGVYTAATDGISKAWVSQLAEKGSIGTAIGFYTSVESICSFFASLIAGLLWAAFGSLVAFIVTAGITLLVSIYFFVFVRESSAN